MVAYPKQNPSLKSTDMTELELQQYILREYPQENARCEWKEFKNLKNSFCGDKITKDLKNVYRYGYK